MPAARRLATVALSISLIGGTATALAPAASAAHSSRCTYNIPDHNAVVDYRGVNYRTGPGLGYVSKGLLYRGDDLRVYCGRGNWAYTKLIHRSKGGLRAGTLGWIRKDMLLQLAG
ncbi:SH3 domain-containing protein [Streptomyces chartreusis]|uniref:hypothetical protein n=1 Tax=Streptomyces chartreusis TaxID=1969 RepID=UPI0038088F55